MKNIFKVTAIILTMAVTIIAHPFLSLNAKSINGIDSHIYNRVLVGTGSNAMIDISYEYGIGYFNIYSPGTVPGNDSAYYYCDLFVNIHGSYSGTVRINVTAPTLPSGQSYTINYCIYNCNANSTTVYNDYIVVKINDGQQYFQIRYFFPAAALENYYGLSSGSYNEYYWLESGYNYFKPLSISNSLTVYNGEVDYSSLLEYNNNSVAYYLNEMLGEETWINYYTEQVYNELHNNISTIVQDLNSIDSELASIYAAMIMTNNKLYSFTNAVIPEYSYSFYILLNNGSNYLNYDTQNYPQPSYTLSNGSQVFNGKRNEAYYIVYISKSNSDAFSANMGPGLAVSTWNTKRYGAYYIHWGATNAYNYQTVTITLNNVSNDEIMPVYLGTYTNMPIEVCNLIDMNLIDPYINKLNDLINAVNGLETNVNVTNNQVTQNVDNYNNNITYVYNVENSLSTQLDLQMQSYIPDNSSVTQKNICTICFNVINIIKCKYV